MTCDHGMMTSRLEPAKQLSPRPQRRNALVVEGGQHGAATDDLAAGVASPLGLVRASDDPILLGTQPGEPLVNHTNAITDLVGMGHRDLRIQGNEEYGTRLWPS
jgi:hypothetical protein